MKLLLSACLLLCAQADVLTGSYDNNRTNATTSETVLTTANVNSASFGRLFALDADGEIYAQPLYMHGVAIRGLGTHNVVFIATMHNSVYAYDGDAAGDPLWKVNLGTPASPAVIGFTDIATEVGILGTPVIDPSSGTLYVVAETVENGQYFHQLHALDIASGEEKFGGPVTISGSVAGTGSGSVKGVLEFSSVLHLQRPALLLANGVVYVAFGSHADQNAYHGWLFGYNASTLAQTAVFCTTPDGEQGAIWQSGRGPAADAEGFIYVATGNGQWDGTTSFSQSFLKLDPKRNLAIADWFTTASWQGDSEVDDDFGSSGVALLPGTSYLIGGDKGGTAYVANESNLGHLTTDDTGIFDKQQVIGYGIFTFAVWNNVFYSQAVNDAIKAFPISSGRIAESPSSQTTATHAREYDGYSVCSNGTAAGSAILWATTTEGNTTASPGTLHAFDARNLAHELWNSDMVVNRDPLGWFSKFANPTVANGKVYVPTFSNRLMVYGLLPKTGITGIASSASRESGAVAPQEIVILFGNGIGPQTTATERVNAQLQVETELAGVEVLFDGDPAPLVYAGSTEIAAIVPASVLGKATTSVVVKYNGVLSAAFVLPVSEAQPSLYSIDGSGVGPAVALNEDLSINSATNPAARGTQIVLYGTGLGLTDPPEADGTVTPLEPPWPEAAQIVTVTVGGQNATVLYAGPAPGSAGILEIDAKIPQSTPTGSAVPVEVTIGTRTGASGITVSVK